MTERTERGDSVRYSFPKLKGSVNYRTWKNNMESCLVTNRVWRACTEVKPPVPTPEPDMIKEDFLALEDKSDED